MLALAIMLPSMAQELGLVKDEDGYTNLRKGPGTKYEIVDQIPDGMFVYFTKGANGWHKIFDSAGEFIGYMAGNKIVKPRRTGSTKYVGRVKDEDGYTNIRKGPGTNHPIVGRVKDGGYIIYSGGEDDRWWKIYKQDGTFRGYMSRNKITVINSPGF